MVVLTIHGRMSPGPQLEAMKEGFTELVDLRTALGLFKPQELAARYLRTIWIDPAAISQSLQFDGWAAADSTPRCLRALIARWGSEAETRERQLRQLVVWVTGSDDLEPGAIIKVLKADTDHHLPAAATCTRTMWLPNAESVDALGSKLEQALAHGGSTFSVA